MKKSQCFVALLATVVLSSSLLPVSANAASTTCKEYTIEAVEVSESSETVTSSEEMALYLTPGESGYSNTITFDCNSLPDNAVITNIEVYAGQFDFDYIPDSVMGIVLPKKLKITSPENVAVEETWGNAGSMTTSTSAFNGEKASGVWSVAYYGTNSSYLKDSCYAGNSYLSSVNMTITYTLE